MIVDIHGHRIEVYTLVSKIHKNVNLELGIKNVFELEGVINSWDCCFIFLKRSLPIFPKDRIILKLKEQRFIKVNAPFIDEISRLAIVILVDKKTYSMRLLKLKFTCNAAILDVVNNGIETVIFKPEEMLGI